MLAGTSWHRFTQPQADGWRQITVLKHPGRVAVAALPDLELDLGAVI